jgi:16S rRNA (cytosine1407-C5)-methyltransferase
MTTKTTFLEKFKIITGLSEEIAIKSLSHSHKSVFVLNTLKSNWQEVLRNVLEIATLTKIQGVNHCYIIEDGKDGLTSLPLFKEGSYYILNYASIIPPLVLDPQPNDFILDMCAAPGGKAFMLARESRNQASLFVNEVDKRRFNNLTLILSNLGVNVVEAFNTPAQGLAYVTDQKFNKILIDAPCSAEGLINLSDKSSLKYWSQKKVKQLRNLQKKIINCAYDLLEDGGKIVYSTCTYSPEENEEVINYIIHKHKDLVVTYIDERLKRDNFAPALITWNKSMFHEDITKCVRILPTELFEGFFVAKLKKIKR